MSFILSLLFSFTVAWLFSEFGPRRWLRITLGVSSLVVSFSLAFAAGMLLRADDNYMYGLASHRLIDTVIANVEAGKKDKLLRELRQLETDWDRDYEDRSRYQKLVGQCVERLNLEKPKGRPAATR